MDESKQGSDPAAGQATRRLAGGVLGAAEVSAQQAPDRAHGESGPGEWSRPGSLLTPLPPTAEGVKIQGQRFGRYVLLERLAEGGMARVYRAVLRDQSGFEKLLAIKRMHRSISQSQDFVTRFVDEARIVSTLNHSNIVQVFDFGQEQGEYYLAMELVVGPDLGTFLAGLQRLGLPMPVPATLYVAAGFLRGLGAAHQRRDPSGEPAPVVHRDMSPQNVLVSRGGEVKVVDFGIAKAAGKLVKTRAGHVMGKVLYMAPEQARGAEVDARTDIFSAGVVLFEMLTGRTPWSGDSAAEVLYKVVNAPVPEAARFNPEVTPQLAAILDRALSRDPERRYPNGNAMARDLEKLLHQTAPGYSRDDLSALVTRTLSLSRTPPQARPEGDFVIRVARDTGPSGGAASGQGSRPQGGTESELDDLWSADPDAGHVTQLDAAGGQTSEARVAEEVSSPPGRPLGSPLPQGAREVVHTRILPYEEVDLEAPDPASDPGEAPGAMAEAQRETAQPGQALAVRAAGGSRRRWPRRLLPLAAVMVGLLCGLLAGSLSTSEAPPTRRASLKKGAATWYEGWRLGLSRREVVRSGDGARLHLVLLVSRDGRPMGEVGGMFLLRPAPDRLVAPLLWAGPGSGVKDELHLVFALEREQQAGAALLFFPPQGAALELDLRD